MTPKQITKMRERHGLTKVHLGELLGHIDRGRLIYAWETGERNPSKAADAALRYVDMLLTSLSAPRLPKLLRVAIETTLRGK